MTTLRQAAVAALEALEITSSEYCQGCWLEVIAALKEALSQLDRKCEAGPLTPRPVGLLGRCTWRAKAYSMDVTYRRHYCSYQKCRVHPELDGLLHDSTLSPPRTNP